MLFNPDPEDLIGKARHAQHEDIEVLDELTVRALAGAVNAGLKADDVLAGATHLPRETRRALRLLIDSGTKARERLLLANQRLIPWEIRRRGLAKRGLATRGLEIADLWQEGMIGLNRAIDTFDPDQGTFSTYAVWWIRQTVSRAIDNTGRIVRLPVHVEDARRSGRPDYEEFAARFDNVESIERLRSIRMGDASTDEGESAADVVGLDDLLMPAVSGHGATVADGAAVAWLLGKLTDRESDILSRRCGLFAPKETLEQIGQDFGVSRERIRQIEAEALQKLRRILGGGTAEAA